MPLPAETHVPEPQEISAEDILAMVDEQARELLGMSGEEFVEAWRSGKFDDEPERSDVMRVALLLPVGW